MAMLEKAWFIVRDAPRGDENPEVSVENPCDLTSFKFESEVNIYKSGVREEGGSLIVFLLPFQSWWT